MNWGEGSGRIVGRSVGGRLPIAGDVRDLILRLGRENPRWGCVRIKGELAKLGIRIAATAIRTPLRRRGLGPAPADRARLWFWVVVVEILIVAAVGSS